MQYDARSFFVYINSDSVRNRRSREDGNTVKSMSWIPLRGYDDLIRVSVDYVLVPHQSDQRHPAAPAQPAGHGAGWPVAVAPAPALGLWPAGERLRPAVAAFHPIRGRVPAAKPGAAGA